MQTDDQIFKDITAKLNFDIRIDASNIMVTVKDGIVILTGTVKYYIDKFIVEDDVKEVQGVRGIVNEIKVNLSGKKERRDEDIAKAVINALEWHPFVPAHEIKVIVDDGVVTLMGMVAFNYQREAAFNAVKYIDGVKSVINKITIKSEAINPEMVKTEIIKEFERSARLDASKIDVNVEGNKVTLKGTVYNWAEVEEASRAAWAIPGVTEVVNLLKVAGREEIY